MYTMFRRKVVYLIFGHNLCKCRPICNFFIDIFKRNLPYLSQSFPPHLIQVAKHHRYGQLYFYDTQNADSITTLRIGESSELV